VVVPWTTGKAVSAVAGLAVSGIAVMIARRRDRATAAGLTLVLGTGWMTAFGPATEPNTYAIFAGCGAWLAVRPGGPRWARAAAVAGTGLLAGTILRGVFPNDTRFNTLGPQPAGALLLLASAAGHGLTAAETAAAPVVFAARVRVGGRLRSHPPVVVGEKRDGAKALQPAVEVE
jgi:hypothetical protein